MNATYAAYEFPSLFSQPVRPGVSAQAMRGIRNGIFGGTAIWAIIITIVIALTGCASMAAKDKAIATLPATGYSQDFDPSLFGFLFGGAYRERVCLGQSCGRQVVIAPQALSATSQSGGAVPCGLYNAPDAPSSGSVGNVSRNQATCPQGTTFGSSGWLDPQGSEYRAWACQRYGSFNGIPCR